MSCERGYVECTFPCDQCPFKDCVCTKFMGQRAYMMKGHMERLRQQNHKGVRLPITGAEFRELRENRHIRQRDAAFFARMSPVTLCSWEKGRKLLSVRQYQNLADVYPWVPPLMNHS